MDAHLQEHRKSHIWSNTNIGRGKVRTSLDIFHRSLFSDRGKQMNFTGDDCKAVRLDYMLITLDRIHYYHNALWSLRFTADSNTRRSIYVVSSVAIRKWQIWSSSTMMMNTIELTSYLLSSINDIFTIVRGKWCISLIVSHYEWTQRTYSRPSRSEIWCQHRQIDLIDNTRFRRCWSESWCSADY